ncbi:MAG: sugar kinase [Candidatus Omnitrophica bacterium]|nr:sugar kinase [Candidatus Omnitrophota bacterium]MCF7877310.1 sugar kinase [Candidatus Omnitrophota bacterium]MCF7878306.1 sugar kinase [Candidatus Omnitrophota bacterium]MCF7892771.1 sugar kinase [Candidatus Omnitrophota bacterium]
MSIVVVGSVGLDSVKTPFGVAKKVLGGSASYFSYAASLFSQVNLIATIGDDFPKKYIKLFNQRSIMLDGLTQTAGKTFSWSGEYGWDMADPRTISTKLGVFADFRPKMPVQYEKSKYIFLANIDPELQKSILKQVKAKKSKIIGCDTMDFWIENKRKELLDLLKDIDIFFINESEARQLTQEPNLLKAARAILKFGPKKIFIKRGEHGVLLVSGRHLFTAPAYLMESVVDPTGAGDTFAGGVMGYLAMTKGKTIDTLRKAAIYGTMMATFAVEDFSLGSLKKATLVKVRKKIKKFKKLVLF